MFLTLINSDFSDVTNKITVEFPNLFNGTRITYTRGFELFGFSFYWYGVLIGIGIVLAYFYAMRRLVKDFGIVKDRAFDVVFAATIGGFLCARIYYCVFTTLNPDSGMKYNFITTFTKIHDGGIAIYGGIIGAVLIGLLFCKIRKVHFRAMADVAALGFLIGQCIGRWGNLINQEAYGEACGKDYLFAMTGTRIAEEMGSGVCVHPCFLYESAWCLAGFLFLHFYSKKLRTYDGEIALLYVAWYGLGRFFIEGLRTDSLMAGKIRISQLVAAVSFIAAIALYVVFKVLAKKRGWVLYVNTDASRELIEHDRLAEEQRSSKKKSRKKATETDAAQETANNADIANSADSADPEAESAEGDSVCTDNENNENNENNEEISEDKEVADTEKDKEDKENGTDN